MQRTTYIYRLVPLMVVLSCGRLIEGLLGSLGALVTGLAVAVAAWALVWLRLFGMRRLRPEFAVLAILPQSLYFILKFVDKETLTPFLAPAWQNMYFVAWLVAVGTIIFSMRPGYHDDRRPVSRDPLFIMMTIITIAYGASTWANYAADIFSI